ncbi:MAG: hypothetical protein DWQ34_28255 [Planctomycetota bacterium]|nr:MAG: hypothetical protein DWQ34_28255 [Planctomycetota bacterium]
MRDITFLPSEEFSMDERRAIDPARIGHVQRKLPAVSSPINGLAIRFKTSHGFTRPVYSAVQFGMWFQE